MIEFQFRYDKDVDVDRFLPAFKMQSHNFFDVLKHLVDGFALRENIFPEASSAPEFSVMVNFDLNQHFPALSRRGTSRPANHLSKSTPSLR